MTIRVGTRKLQTEWTASDFTSKRNIADLEELPHRER